MRCLKWIITNVFQYEMDWVRVPEYCRYGYRR